MLFPKIFYNVVKTDLAAGLNCIKAHMNKHRYLNPDEMNKAVGMLEFGIKQVDLSK